MDGEITSHVQSERKPRKVRPRLLVAGIAILILVSISLISCSDDKSVFHGLPFNPVEPAPDFTLIDQHRQPVRLSDYRGNVVLLYFGFLNCPDECPMTMGIWKQVANLLGKDAERVRFVMITVDPERDSPEDMGEFLSIFNPDFIGLSGTLEEIEDVARPYAVSFRKLEVTEEEVKSGHVTGSDADHEDGHEHSHDAEEEVYLVNHTTLAFVIDPQGQLVMAYPLGTGAEEIVADVRQLLN